MKSSKYVVDTDFQEFGDAPGSVEMAPLIFDANRNHLKIQNVTGICIYFLLLKYCQAQGQGQGQGKGQSQKSKVKSLN